jgi:hypothetical protein
MQIHAGRILGKRHDPPIKAHLARRRCRNPGAGQPGELPLLALQAVGVFTDIVKFRQIETDRLPTLPIEKSIDGCA